MNAPKTNHGEFKVAAEHIYEELIHTLRHCLEHLEQLRMHDPQDKEILHIKGELREKIRQLESRINLPRAA